MLRKALVWVASGFVVAVLCTAVAAFWGYDLATQRLLDKVADSIQGASSARGWEVGWSEISVAPGGIELREMTGRGPHESWVRADVLLVEFSPWEILWGRREPTRVVLDGVEAELDVRSVQPEQMPHGPASSRVDSAVLPMFVMRAREITLRGLPGLEPVTARSLMFEGEPVDRGRWSGSFMGWCAAGCGEGQTLRGQITRDGSEVDALMELQRPVALRLQVPGREDPVEVTVQRVSISSGVHGVRIGLGEVGVPIPDLGRRRGHLQIRQLELDLAEGLTGLMKGAPFKVVAFGPHLQLYALEPDHNQPTSSPPAHDPLLLLDRFISAGQRHAPAMARVKVYDGTLTLEKQGVVITGIRAGGSPRELSAHGQWGPASLSATLRPSVSDLSITFRDLSLQGEGSGWPLRPMWSRLHPELASLRGRVDGTVDIGLDNRQVSRAPTAAATTSGRHPDRSNQAMLGPRVERRGVEVTADVSLTDGTVALKGLSPEPVGDLAAGLKVALAIWPPQEGRGWEVEVADSELELPSRAGGTVGVRFSGRMGREKPGSLPRIHGQIGLEETDCHVALSAIPLDLIPETGEHLKAQGRFSPRVDFSVDLGALDRLQIRFNNVAGSCEVTDLGPLSPDFLTEKFTRQVREGVTSGPIFIGPASGNWVSMRSVPEHVQASMYLTEDVRFYRHGGFVPNLIRRALVLNLQKGRYAYGGSTISQQLVKNLFLTRNKSLSRKLEEAIIVWRMESVLTKKRILELYMNVVEFGPNVYGLRRAAHYYFGKHPRQLTVTEGLFLAALKPAPWQGARFRTKGASPSSGFWYRRMTKLMRRLERAGVVTEQEVAQWSPYVVEFVTATASR